MDSLIRDMLFYEPENLDLIKGNENAIAELRRFALSFKMGRYEKPVLVYGPTGTGKSTSVRLLARENGWNVVELTASDYRDKNAISGMLAAASQSRGLFGGRNLIMLDDIDELSPKFDKGASAAIVDLINNSKNPIIMIANDMWDQKITFLRGVTVPVEFKKPKQFVVEEILATVSSEAGIKANKDVITAIARRSNGDVRSAIGDLLILGDAPDEALDYIGLRDRKGYIFETLDRIFLSNTIAAPLRAIANAEDAGEMLIKWIDQNIPKRYSYVSDIATAYENLSDATIYYTRALRAQYYTYWRYMNVMMSSGVALSKNVYPKVTARYEFPKTIKELSASKGERSVSNEIAKRLQRKIHESLSKIKEHYIPLLAAMVKNSDEGDVDDFLESKYGLERKQIDFLKSIRA
ncbi:MAG: replication factor C large subunit [Candidatus Micrarchaeaceae archaeon]